jgi:hypothetical protein
MNIRQKKPKERVNIDNQFNLPVYRTFYNLPIVSEHEETSLLGVVHFVRLGNHISLLKVERSFNAHVISHDQQATRQICKLCIR